MSPISFATLASDHPELGTVASWLDEWLASRPPIRFIELNRVAKELCRAHPISDKMQFASDLMKLLEIAESHRAMRPVFRVRDPNGDITSETYSSISEIPNSVSLNRDPYQSFNPLTEGDVVAGFLRE